MLRASPQLLRRTLLTSLGLLGSGCGGQVPETTAGQGATTASESTARAGNGGEIIADTATTAGAGGRQLGEALASEPTDTPTPSACPSPQPHLQGEVVTGLVQCRNGIVHRPASAQCSNLLAQRPQSSRFGDCPTRAPDVPDGGVTDAGSRNVDCAPAGGQYECQRDSECDAQPYGHCELWAGAPGTYCAYGCVTDEDCAADQACVCGAEIGQCRDANCREDSDCGSGSLCALWTGYDNGCSQPSGLTCHRPQDECRVAEDCGPQGDGLGLQPRHLCVDDDGVRQCRVSPNVVCGRPFLVQEQIRLPPAEARPDYAEALTVPPSLAALTVAEREELAQAWIEIGRMEHASVAAFARFALQLMHLGAPCELLTDTQRAMADESEHARLAFSLASHYAGRKLGPGPMSMRGVEARNDLASVLCMVIAEGCVGETVATLEASEALAHCQVKEVAAVWRRIVGDEARHAELAWRFVAWALEQQPELLSVAVTEFNRAIQGAQLASPPATSSPRFDPLPHGIVSEPLRVQIRQSACRDVIRPCAEKLLATVASRRPTQRGSISGPIASLAPPAEWLKG